MLSRHHIEGLYRRSGYAVLQRARQLLGGNEAEARAVTHEVFAQLIERPATLKSRAKLLPSLFTRTSQLALGRLRELLHGADDAARRLLELVHPGADDAERKATAELLARVIREEEAPTAELVHYHHVDGLSLGQVAKLVGVPRVTLSQKLSAPRTTASKSKHPSPLTWFAFHNGSLSLARRFAFRWHTWHCDHCGLRLRAELSERALVDGRR